MPLPRALIVGFYISLLASPWPAEADVAYVTSENGGVSVIDVTTLKIVREVEVGGTTPRGLAVSADGRYLLTANKNSGDMSVIDSQSGTLMHRIPLGPGPEFLRVVGGKAFVTYEPEGMRNEHEDSGKPIAAEVAIVDFVAGKILLSFPSGIETEGLEFSADGKYVVTTNEGDETISVHDITDGRQVRSIETRDLGVRPRGIAAVPGDKGYVVTFESSANFVVFDGAFGVIKNMATKAGPNGVAFDPTGQFMLVAAARAGMLQIFDATTFALVREVPIGKRCWHFTYTPNGAKILVACGRSNDVQVIDAKTFVPGAPIPGFKLPWGIVTYPKAHGSLDVPPPAGIGR